MKKNVLAVGDLIILPGTDNNAVIAKKDGKKYYAVPINKAREVVGKPIEIEGQINQLEVCGILYGDYAEMLKGPIPKDKKPKDKPKSVKKPDQEESKDVPNETETKPASDVKID